MQPLTGTRILDLTRLLPGGLCTRILADLGADVLKVEEPGRGDYLRAFPPLAGEQSALFAELNRGKRSIALNLKAPEGRAVLLELARRADVLVEGFRPGVLARLSLSADELRAANPRLIVCSISGYGQAGQLRGRAGHDINYLGYAGALPFFQPRGGGPPIVPGLQIADIGGGALPAAIGILAALLERQRTGRGQALDISMTGNLLQWLALAAAELRAAGAAPEGGRGPLSGGYACYSVYRCADGMLTVGAVEPRFWANLCRMLGREDLIPLQYAPWPEQERLFLALDTLFLTRTRDEWLAYFGDAEVCVGPALSLAEALELHEGRMVTVGGAVQVGGLFGEAAATPAPGLGEHSAAVLAELGYGPERVAELRGAGVIG